MGKCIAITGAGAGLGRALARCFAGDGHTLLVLGRTRASLDVRAGQMNDADSRSPVTGELARLFAEENLKRGLNLRERPISNFKSVAEFIRLLSHLPSDLNVPEIVLEARRE